MNNCPYCQGEPRLVKGYVIYPRIPKLHNDLFWFCEPCDAYVGCHKGTRNPLGRLANKELRRAKIKAHAAFDPLWKARGGMSRREAYAWLSTRLELPPEKTHIGMFDVETCLKVVHIMKEG